MHEEQSWRNLLADIISNPREKQRLAEELGVKPITLSRWASGESTPRSDNLRHLLEVLPQHREQLLALIQKEKGFEEFSNEIIEDTHKEIPTEFYTQILASLSSSMMNLRFWSITQLIIQQALKQLDPERLGMSIWIVTCMPPSGTPPLVHSLRERIGNGTPPWGANLEQKGLFLGAESLAGNVVTLFRPSIIENLDEELILPVSLSEYEKSCAIYPLLYSGRIAGAFMVSSTQYNYFLPQSRSSLIHDYANLVALAFDPKDFYEPEQIALSIMPDQTKQKPFFAHFRNHFSRVMHESVLDKTFFNNAQAEQKVWQILEKQLLNLSMPGTYED